MTTSTTLSRVLLALPWVLRILAATVGAYLFCWGFIALTLAATYAAGLSFHDAEHLSAMLGMLVYLGLFLWCFAARSTGKVWVVLLGGAGLMTGAAALVQRALV